MYFTSFCQLWLHQNECSNSCESPRHSYSCSLASMLCTMMLLVNARWVCNTFCYFFVEQCMISCICVCDNTTSGGSSFDRMSFCLNFGSPFVHGHVDSFFFAIYTSLVCQVVHTWLSLYAKTNMPFTYVHIPSCYWKCLETTKKNSFYRIAHK